MDLFDAAKKPTQEAEILVLVPASQLCDTYSPLLDLKSFTYEMMELS